MESHALLLYDVYVCVQTAEEMQMMTQPATTSTEDELDEVRETNTYPMITLSVDSETEAESNREQDPTSIGSSEPCSP